MIWIYHVTVTSHERHGVSSHGQFDCSFNRLLRPNKENIKAQHYWSWGVHRWVGWCVATPSCSCSPVNLGPKWAEPTTNCRKKIKLALCCRGFCEDFRKQKFTKIKRVEHFQIAQFLCEPWGKILKKIGFGTFYQYGQIHVYFKSIWFMFVIKLLKTLYGMCVEQIIHWIRSPKKQILWKTSYIFSDRNTFFFI